MNNRALALDALRGYAIITMVLSATIVTHVLPGWMSHAQTPPQIMCLILCCPVLLG